jgi:hypothetical protein
MAETKEFKGSEPNPSELKGFEKIIDSISTFVIKVRFKISDIFYGKFQDQDNPNPIKRALDKGIINILGDLASVDFCALLNYAINATRLPGAAFNPNEPPDAITTKWKIQKKAFDIQLLIDNFYSKYGTSLGSDSRTGLIELIRQVNLGFENLADPLAGLQDPDIQNNFPETQIITDFIQKKKDKFTNYASSGIINESQVQSVFDDIDKLRSFLVVIQSLTDPANIVGFIGSGLSKSFQDDLNKINKLIPVEKLIPLLQNTLKSIKNINSIAKKIIYYIDFGKSIIKICVALVKAFNAVRAVILVISNLTPSMFSTQGVSLTLGEVYQQKLKNQGIDKFISILNQIIKVFQSITSFVSDLVIILTDISNKLNLILLNIQSCNPELAKDIEDVKNETDALNETLKAYLNSVNQAREAADTSYGGYTISIVTEELTDEGISLKRRYGVALNSNNIIAVQSTPTFASLDLIIINEVKQLLDSKGLVITSETQLSTDSIVIVSEALKYADDSALTVDDLKVVTEKLEDNENSDLTKFIKNLPGGRALRKKVQANLAKVAQK